MKKLLVAMMLLWKQIKCGWRGHDYISGYHYWTCRKCGHIDWD